MFSKLSNIESALFILIGSKLDISNYSIEGQL